MSTFVVKDEDDFVILKMEAANAHSVPTSVSKEEADDPLNLAAYAEALMKSGATVSAITSRMGRDVVLEEIGADEERTDFRTALAEARARLKERADDEPTDLRTALARARARRKDRADGADK